MDTPWTGWPPTTLHRAHPGISITATSRSPRQQRLLVVVLGWGWLLTGLLALSAGAAALRPPPLVIDRRIAHVPSHAWATLSRQDMARVGGLVAGLSLVLPVALRQRVWIIVTPAGLALRRRGRRRVVYDLAPGLRWDVSEHPDGTQEQAQEEAKQRRDQLHGLQTVIARPRLYRNAHRLLLFGAGQQVQAWDVYGGRGPLLQERLQAAVQVMGTRRTAEEWTAWLALLGQGKDNR